jgi:hypothetical protein
MRFDRRGQPAELHWRSECERRMHAESNGRWIRLGHEFTAGRLHIRAAEPWPRLEGISGAGTHCPRDEFVPRSRREGGSSAPARMVEPPAFSPKVDMAAAAAAKRLAARLGILFREECGRAPRD